ncbi:MAG: arginine--tRNA ligase [Asgard group archaeon]|nr:arginine--tRNA ligase [Asgard group archaeon]
MTNPETYIRTELQKGLEKTLEKLAIEEKPKIQSTEDNITFGEYNFPVFKIAVKQDKKPQILAELIAAEFPKHPLISSVSAKNGFVNFCLNKARCGKLILTDILNNDQFYYNSLFKNKKVIVEHTSANPNGPIHIGNFRGSVIGDTFSRILAISGANVKTHFYVDDLGHQIPVLVLGYQLYKKYHTIPKKAKIDHFLGKIYAITHTMYDIQKLKKSIEKSLSITFSTSSYWLTENFLEHINKEGKKKPEEKADFLKRFDFLYAIQSNIYEKEPELYDRLKTSFEKDSIDLPKAVLKLNRQYMQQKKETVEAVRSTCKDVLDGQKEELALLNIHHDNYDWEADLLWSGKVDEVLQKLDEEGFLLKDGQARLFNANKAAKLEGARAYLGLKTDYEVPEAILITSTGDTLYLLRDIAYSLKKVDEYNADKVFNVIGKPQELTQTQLNLALRAIGRTDVANKTWHLNYEYMELKGALTRMSARRMQYITPLELFEKTKQAVFDNFLKERNYPTKEKEKIAEIVAIGAIKYSIINVGLLRKLIFDPQKVVSLTENTSPFIQYAYARTQNILNKTDFKWNSKIKKTLESLGNEEEWLLILILAQMKRIVQKSANEIKPEIICNYLFKVANNFNKFYEKHRVLDAPSNKLKLARLSLVKATGHVLSAGLDILGISAPKRM